MLATTPKPTRTRLVRAAALLGLLALAGSGAQARTSWSVDLNIGLPLVGVGAGYYGYYGHGGYYRPWWGPRVIVAAPPLVWVANPPVVVESAIVQTAPQAVLQPAPGRPDPVIYPRNSQNAQQTEADRQECNRWATTQPAALADGSVFQRAVEACMDGRGYSMK